MYMGRRLNHRSSPLYFWREDSLSPSSRRRQNEDTSPNKGQALRIVVNTEALLHSCNVYISRKYIVLKCMLDILLSF